MATARTCRSSGPRANIRRAIRATAVVLILCVTLPGCVYFNTFYNAKKNFRAAEKQNKDSQGRGINPNKRMYEDAIAKAAKIVQKHPKSKYYDDALFLIGVSYFRIDNYPKAEASFRELLATQPKSSFAEESQLYLARCRVEMGDEAAAFRAFTDLAATARKPEWRAEAEFQRAQFFAGHDAPDSAAATYQKLLDQYPRSERASEARLQEADVLRKLKRPQEAIALYAPLIHSADTAFRYEALVGVGQAYYEAGQNDSGIAVFSTMAEGGDYEDSIGNVRLLLAKGLRSSGDIPSAWRQYEQVAAALEATRWAAEAYFNMAEIKQFIENDLAAAKELYDNSRQQNARGELAALALSRSANISKLEQFRKELGRGELTKRQVEEETEAHAPYDPASMPRLERVMSYSPLAARPPDYVPPAVVLTAADSAALIQGPPSPSTIDSTATVQGPPAPVPEGTTDEIHGPPAPGADTSGILVQGPVAPKPDGAIATQPEPQAPPTSGEAVGSAVRYGQASPPQTPSSDENPEPATPPAGEVFGPPHPSSQTPGQSSLTATNTVGEQPFGPPSPTPRPREVSTAARDSAANRQKVELLSERTWWSVVGTESLYGPPSPVSHYVFGQGNLLGPPSPAVMEQPLEQYTLGPPTPVDTSSKVEIAVPLDTMAAHERAERIAARAKQKEETAENDKAAALQSELAELYRFDLAYPESALVEYEDMITRYAGTPYAARALLASADIYAADLHDTTQSDQYLRRILTEYPYTDYAGDAIMRLGLQGTEADTAYPARAYAEAEDAFLKSGNPRAAIRELKDFIKRYPRSRLVPNAEFAIADLTDRYFPPEDSSVIWAYQEIAANYPNTDLAKAANAKLTTTVVRPPKRRPPPAPEKKEPVLAGKDDPERRADSARQASLPRAPRPKVTPSPVFPSWAKGVVTEVQIIVYRIHIDYDGRVSRTPERILSSKSADINQAADDAIKRIEFFADSIPPDSLNMDYRYEMRIQPPAPDLRDTLGGFR